MICSRVIAHADGLYLQAANVTFGAIRHKDVRGLQGQALVQLIADGFPQRSPALLCAVTAITSLDIFVVISTVATLQNPGRGTPQFQPQDKGKPHTTQLSHRRRAVLNKYPLLCDCIRGVPLGYFLAQHLVGNVAFPSVN